MTNIKVRLILIKLQQLFLRFEGVIVLFYLSVIAWGNIGMIA